MSWANYKDKLNKYFWFSKEEWKAFIITVLVGAIIYSWNGWGAARFDAAEGIKNLIVAIILVAIVVFVHHAAQRIFAPTIGFRAEQKLWWYGLLIGLMLAILSRGWLVYFFAASSTLIHLMPVHRLGSFRYGANMASISKVALMGPFANAVLALLTKWLMEWSIVSQEAGHRFFMLNAMFALMNLLPIPPLDGSRIMYDSRAIYVLVLLTFAAFAAIGHFFHVYSATAAFVVGIGASLLITKMKGS
ncbi:MAG TPA: hypothetical protein VJJ82_01475 [Candidatus Nanoarchaeia archaeon]|nr:hypothetical protein [Candidatus Nanoarchaeia archaeon]